MDRVRAARGDFCHRCGRRNPVWYADAALWNEGTESRRRESGRDEVLCPSCFVDAHEQQAGVRQGFLWRLSLEDMRGGALMATYSRREVHTTRVEFLVPASWPSGACWVEVQQAIAAAMQELRAAGHLGPEETPADDLIRVRPGDSEVIVSYEAGSQAFADRSEA